MLVCPSPGQKWGSNGQKTETSVIVQFHFSWSVNTLSLFISLFQVRLVSQSLDPTSSECSTKLNFQSTKLRNRFQSTTIPVPQPPKKAAQDDIYLHCLIPIMGGTYLMYLILSGSSPMAYRIKSKLLGPPFIAPIQLSSLIPRQWGLLWLLAFTFMTLSTVLCLILFAYKTPILPLKPGSKVASSLKPSLHIQAFSSYCSNSSITTTESEHLSTL